VVSVSGRAGKDHRLRLSRPKPRRSRRRWPSSPQDDMSGELRVLLVTGILLTSSVAVIPSLVLHRRAYHRHQRVIPCAVVGSGAKAQTASTVPITVVRRIDCLEHCCSSLCKAVLQPPSGGAIPAARRVRAFWLLRYARFGVAGAGGLRSAASGQARTAHHCDSSLAPSCRVKGDAYNVRPPSRSVNDDSGIRRPIVYRNR